MLKRIIATLIVKNNIVVQSIGFNKYLPVGRPEIAVEFLNDWGVDEIILLDIDAARENRIPDIQLVKRVSKKCFVPLTVGGGIRSLDHAEALLHAGADKIGINHSLSNQDLIDSLAASYGNQFLVGSVDILKTKEGYLLFDHLKKQSTNIDPFQFVKKIKNIGELFITAVHCDGKYCGYDIELINKATSLVDVPVIAGGGARNGKDMVELFSKTNVSAASAANFFHFSEHSVTMAKGFLVREKIPVRNETHANYSAHDFDTNCRLIKQSDQVLEDMRFVKIEREII